MDEFLNKNRLTSVNNQATNQIQAEKSISSNDIRARIFPIPRAMLERLVIDVDEYDMCFNDSYVKNRK